MFTQLKKNLSKEINNLMRFHILFDWTATWPLFDDVLWSFFHICYKHVFNFIFQSSFLFVKLSVFEKLFFDIVLFASNLFLPEKCLQLKLIQVLWTYLVCCSVQNKMFTWYIRQKCLHTRAMPIMLLLQSD